MDPSTTENHYKTRRTRPGIFSVFLCRQFGILQEECSSISAYSISPDRRNCLLKLRGLRPIRWSVKFSTYFWSFQPPWWSVSHGSNLLLTFQQNHHIWQCQDVVLHSWFGAPLYSPLALVCPGHTLQQGRVGPIPGPKTKGKRAPFVLVESSRIIRGDFSIFLWLLWDENKVGN